MRMLIDTNIIMDVLVGRQPFYEQSRYVMQLCGEGVIQGCLAAHTITNLFYILRKYYSNDECREILLSLFDIFHVEQVDSDKLRAALENKAFRDFEDCLQVECGLSGKAEYIVTRDRTDFKMSQLPCLTPEDIYKKYPPEAIGL